MHKWYYPVTVLVVSLILFVFVAPQYVDRGIDFVNGKAHSKIPHVWNVPFRLGLDLLGGTHLVYQADLSKLSGTSEADAMQGVRDVIERRVNFFGVAEPLVQVAGRDRLIIELAGIRDVNQAIQLIGETPFLEFAEENANTKTILEAQQKGQRTDELPFSPTGFNGKHIKRAQVVFDPQTGRPQVSLQMTDEGAKLFATITKRDIGKMIAIYLDGSVISAPTVQSEITDGNAVITGNFSVDEAKTLTNRLNSGALPVPISLVSQQTIGASLGSASLHDSLKAGLYGLLLVAIFMIVFYRLPGLVAVLALLVYTLIVLAFYKMVPVTLTLAGIAGFILSLGMAVDANILIFARMKEELTAGRSISQSVHEGFRRAWLSIRDGHMTTLIGAAGLYGFTTSIVKGFALTLGIGVIASLFTSTIVTRILLNLFVRPWVEKRKWLFG